MDKWMICVLLSSFAGSILYGIWLVLSRILKKEEYTYALQCSINMVVILFSGLALGGVGLCIFIDLVPGNVSLPMYTNSVKEILTLLSYVWVFGVVCKIGKFVWQRLELRKEAKTYFPSDLNTKGMLNNVCMDLGIKKNIQICQSLLIPTARIEGYFRPRICMPAIEYSDDMLKAILTHELVHYLNHDRWVRQCALLLGCVHWFNPLVESMYQSLERWNEFYCDYRVCNHYSIEKKAYMDTLLKMAQYGLDWQKRYKKTMIMQLPLMGNEKVLTERINRIMSFSGKKKQRTVMAVVLCMMFVLLGSTTALAAGSGVESVYADTLLRTYEDQSVIEMESTEEVILQEYEIAPEDVPYVPELMANEVLPNAQPTASFSSTITEDLWQSGRFQASAGQNIYVSVSVIPNDVEVKVGIMEPDGTWRLVIEDGNINHTFILDQTGTYVVFVWNETTTTVNIIGYYTTTDTN